jgi:hypothetical protein
MQKLTDYLNRGVRFTEERKRHILENHPELKNHMEKISEVILDPEMVVTSKLDSSIELYYRYYTNTNVGNKYLCAIVKVLENDFFIVTVYFTDKIKEGKLIWEKK